MLDYKAGKSWKYNIEVIQSSMVNMRKSKIGYLL